MASPFQILLLASFALVWTLEAVAHDFVLRNRPGGETLSHLTRRAAEQLTGRYWHLAVALPPLLLLLDLEGWL